MTTYDLTDDWWDRLRENEAAYLDELWERWRAQGFPMLIESRSQEPADVDE